MKQSNTASHPIAAGAAQGERHRWVHENDEEIVVVNGPAVSVYRLCVNAQVQR